MVFQQTLESECFKRTRYVREAKDVVWDVFPASRNRMTRRTLGFRGDLSVQQIVEEAEMPVRFMIIPSLAGVLL